MAVTRTFTVTFEDEEQARSGVALLQAAPELALMLERLERELTSCVGGFVSDKAQAELRRAKDLLDRLAIGGTE